MGTHCWRGANDIAPWRGSVLGRGVRGVVLAGPTARWPSTSYAAYLAKNAGRMEKPAPRDLAAPRPYAAARGLNASIRVGYTSSSRGGSNLSKCSSVVCNDFQGLAAKLYIKRPKSINSLAAFCKTEVAS